MKGQREVNGKWSAKKYTYGKCFDESVCSLRMSSSDESLGDILTYFNRLKKTKMLFQEQKKQETFKMRQMKM